MATYQEQLARLTKQKATRKKAESSLEKVASAIAEALTPYVLDGTLTQDKAAKIIARIIHNIANIKRKHDA